MAPLVSRLSVLDDAWVSSRNGTRPGPTSTHTFRSYAVVWLASLIQHPLPKVGVTAFIIAFAQAEKALTPALVYVFWAWCVDMAMGVLRAVADPAMELRGDKARNGLLKLLVIPMVAIAAAVTEGIVLEAIGWDPAGKFVLGACVAMFWEETISIQRNARHFFKSLKLRMTKIQVLTGADEVDEVNKDKDDPHTH